MTKCHYEDKAAREARSKLSSQVSHFQGVAKLLIWILWILQITHIAASQPNFREI